MYNGMYMALVRFFCVAGPRGHAYGDTSLAYLQALAASPLGIRAIAINGIDLQSVLNRRDGSGWEAWRFVVRTFAEPLENGYLNVVCAPVGLQYGAKKTAGDLAGQMAGGLSDQNEVVTSADTALSALLTYGVKNVAITSLEAGTVSPRCFDALRLYDLVVCNNADDFKRLACADVRAELLPPETLEWRLEKMLNAAQAP